MIKTYKIVILNTIFLMGLFCVSAQSNYDAGIIQLDKLDIKQVLSSINLDSTNIVILGEEAHYDGVSLGVNQQIINELVINHGFTHLIIESDFFGLHQLNRYPPNLQFIRQNVFKCWSSVTEFQSVLKLVENSSLTIYGFDSNHHGRYSKDSLLNFLDNILGDNLSIEDKKFFFEVTKRLLINGIEDATILFDQERYNSIIDESIKLQSGNFEKHEMKNLKGFAQQTWSHKLGWQELVKYRELNMVENVKYLLENDLKGKKVIILGANIHIQPFVVNLSQHSPYNIGDEVVKNYKGITLLPLVYGGKRGSSYGKIDRVPKPPKGTIARKLKKTKYKFALIDLKNIDESIKIYDVNETSPRVYGNYLIYIEKTYPAIKM